MKKKLFTPSAWAILPLLILVFLMRAAESVARILKSITLSSIEQTNTQPLKEFSIRNITNRIFSPANHAFIKTNYVGGISIYPMTFACY